jgi:membrane protease YdiL (CAAX protease family)
LTVEPQRRIRLSLVVYGALALAALIWGLLRGSPDLYHHPEPWLGLVFPVSTGVAGAAGLAVAIAVIALTRVLVRRAHWARALHVEFRELLGPLSHAEVAVFALTSGIAEEMLFRGALQPAVGLFWAGLVFGLVHVGPRRTFLPWTAWAVVMGWVFGALYAATGELLAPVVAHIAINYQNLRFIDAYDPTPPSESALRADDPPPLLGRRTG